MDLLLLQDGLTVFFAVIIEALPFVLLGSVVSAFLAVTIRDEWLLKHMPKNLFLSHVAISFLGFLFPVCECGNLPVAKRLIQKGVSVSQAVTFLLAAPVLNPLVLLSTWAAFSFAPGMVVWRFALSWVIALGAGLLASQFSDQTKLLTAQFAETCSVHDHFPKTPKEKLHLFLKTVRTEIFSLMGALAFGAAIAAITTLLPREVVVGLATSPVLAIIVMMLLALIMSICSTVDAFVALGYVGSFPLSSIGAFLVFGPMIDFRAISLMRTVFRTRFVAFLVVFVSTSVILASSLISLGGY